MGPRTFNAGNARGADVVDLATLQVLDHVVSVNIDTGEVLQAIQPLRLVGDEIATKTMRFDTIHPIYGDSITPQLFHCYGRKPLSA